MSISQESLEKLKKIHYNHTGQKLSDAEALEFGIRLKDLVKTVMKKIPEDDKKKSV